LTPGCKNNIKTPIPFLSNLPANYATFKNWHGNGMYIIEGIFSVPLKTVIHETDKI